MARESLLTFAQHWLDGRGLLAAHPSLRVEEVLAREGLVPTLAGYGWEMRREMGSVLGPRPIEEVRG